MPSEDQQNLILDIGWDLGKNRDKNAYTDPRYGLAAACAGWKSLKAKEFLKYCLTSNDNSLNYVAENSFKGKYIKLR